MWYDFASGMLAMQPVYEAVFSHAGGYNLVNRWVCSEFRSMVPKVDPLVYLDALLRDKRGPKDFQPSNKIMTEALELDLLYLFQANESCFPGSICEEVAKHGRLEMLSWLVSVGYVLTNDVCLSAALHGQLEIFKWLITQGCPLNNHIFSSAALGGHLKILKWLRKHGWFRFAKFYVKLRFT